MQTLRKIEKSIKAKQKNLKYGKSVQWFRVTIEMKALPRYFPGL